MKIAVAFLLVALSCCYQDTNAGLLGGLPVSTPDVQALKTCLSKVLAPDVPNVVDGLGKVVSGLCDIQKGLSDGTGDLCKAVKETLIDTGCTADAILSTLNIKAVEDIGASVGESCKPVAGALVKLLQQATNLPVVDSVSGAVLSTVCSLGLDGILGKLTPVVNNLLGSVSGAANNLVDTAVGAGGNAVGILGGLGV